RSFYIAGQAARLGDRPNESLKNFRQAEKFADTQEDLREALWGQLIESAARKQNRRSAHCKGLRSSTDRLQTTCCEWRPRMMLWMSGAVLGLGARLTQWPRRTRSPHRQTTHLC